MIKDRHAYIIILILLVSIAIPRLTFYDVGHGDEYDDACVLNAGKNFVRFGFIKCWFLPVFEPNLDTPKNAYTHYPAIPYIINGVLRLIFKTDSLVLFRCVSLLLSLLSVLFWYLFIKKFTNSILIGLVCAIFYLINPLFIFGMDSLQECCYSDFLRALAFFMFILIVNRPKRKNILLIMLWITVFLESLVTFEYIIYLSLFFILFKILFRESSKIFSKRDIFILLLAPVAGFLLHLLQNAWYFGGFSAALEDLKVSAVQRTFSSYELPFLNFVVWFELVLLKNFSLTFLVRYYALLIMIIFSISLYPYLPSGSKKALSPLLRLLSILVICGTSWYIFFPAHSLAHTDVLLLARHLLPAAAVFFTILSYILFSSMERININIGLKRGILSLVLILSVTYIVFKGTDISKLPITERALKFSKEFIQLKEKLLYLNKISGKADTIGTNFYRSAFICYYTDRHCEVILNESSLINSPSLPKYFILFLKNTTPVSPEFIKSLEQRYNTLFFCGFSSFPVKFFELKDNR